jgi:hypothetical protein
MTTRFDILPLDVIRHVLYPYLDYESRNNVNMFLQPYEKISNRMKKETTKQFELQFNVARLRPGLCNIDSSFAKGEEKIIIMTKYFKDYVLQNLVISQHNLRFRTVLLGKLNEFSNPESYERAMPLPKYMQDLLTLSSNILSMIESKYPYLHELRTSLSDEKWSAVDAGPPKIVDSAFYARMLHVKREAALKEKRLIRLRHELSYKYVSKSTEDRFETWVNNRMDAAKSTKN